MPTHGPRSTTVRRPGHGGRALGRRGGATGGEGGEPLTLDGGTHNAHEADACEPSGLVGCVPRGERSAAEVGRDGAAVSDGHQCDPAGSTLNRSATHASIACRVGR